jgi:hypothetical protein
MDSLGASESVTIRTWQCQATNRPRDPQCPFPAESDIDQGECQCPGTGNFGVFPQWHWGWQITECAAAPAPARMADSRRSPTHDIQGHEGPQTSACPGPCRSKHLGANRGYTGRGHSGRVASSRMGIPRDPHAFGGYHASQARLLSSPAVFLIERGSLSRGGGGAA